MSHTPLRVRCPGCKAVYPVESFRVGTLAQCGNCREPLEITAAGAKRVRLEARATGGCPACGKRYDVSVKFAEREVTCGCCEQRFRTAAATPAVVDGPEAAHRLPVLGRDARIRRIA